MNNVSMVGRLTREPELRQTQNTGTSVVNFTVAIDRPVKGQDKTADFIPVVAWEKTAERVAQHVRKGHRVGVTGRLQTRTYETPDGQKRSVMEVVAQRVDFLEPKHDTNGSTPTDAVDVPDDIPF